MSTAILRHARISPLKAREVADLIRGKAILDANTTLKFMPNKAAAMIRKLLLSAIANAEQEGQDIDLLAVYRIVVDEAPRMKRMMPRAKGRSNQIIKRSSHIKIELREENR